MANTAIHPGVVTGLAFALAFVFGAVAYRVSFCTMGAITDIVNFGDWRRMRMWLLAIAVAIVGTARNCLAMPGSEWFGHDAAMAAALPAPVRRLLAAARTMGALDARAQSDAHGVCDLVPLGPASLG